MSQTQNPSLKATKRAAKAPGKVTVSKPAAQPLAALVAAVTAQPAPAAPAKPVTVALRGGAAISTVKLTGKAYRVGAAHNKAWWDQCTAAVAAGNGTAAVADMIKAGVPAIFVGYVVRRGYMVAA